MRIPALLLAAALAQAARAAEAPPPRVLTLDEAVQTAVAHQPQLAQARASATAAGARADQARADLLPQVNGQAQIFRRTTNGTTLGGASTGSFDTQNQFSFTASANQLVWDFGQTTGRWTAARRSADAERESARESELTTVLDVRTAFFQARAARDLAQVARATLQNQQAHLAQIDAFVKIGTRPPIDLATARTSVANAQVQLVQAENNYATGRARLNQAMGVEGPLDYEVASDTLLPVDGEDATADVLLDEALRDRPDLAAALRRLEAADSSLGSARGGYFPALSVGASATDVGTDAPDLRRTWNVAFGATLTVPIFEGGRTRAQVAEAAANVTVATSQRDTLRQQIRVDLENARLTVRAAKTSLDASRDALDNAREQLRLAEGRYRTGAGSALELSDAQLAATNAEAQQVNAEYQLASARAQLLAALGRR
ncbi:TolC family protein [Anaeromyxobacter oryzae]|uniref:Transporter n=1 Tax=Anaeromyxobacter oryzae TaxID=2918170 RepID=A0ABN6MJE1_9BACT|nr:TolC family protein [Anaeromyxobacter oryzae]BDG01146.1 transporter [Anaeromyxobacter oryzae]